MILTIEYLSANGYEVKVQHTENGNEINDVLEKFKERGYVMLQVGQTTLIIPAHRILLMYMETS